MLVVAVCSIILAQDDYDPRITGLNGSFLIA